MFSQGYYVPHPDSIAVKIEDMDETYFTPKTCFRQKSELYSIHPLALRGALRVIVKKRRSILYSF